MRFEWDERKNLVNQRKHGISFEVGSRAFFDPFCISLKDCIVDGEQRWRTYGVVDNFLLVMVAHTVKEHDDEGQLIEVIRLISARRATGREQEWYEEENR